ncbi:MAG TPA: VOC family protein [Longimicrobiales bacterium]|nr:VOC family protein [Longimicrobiales bacterium]
MTTTPREPFDGELAPVEPHEGEELAVSLTVKDLDRSLAWYRDVLAFRITQRHEREGRAVAASLAAGGVKVLLGQDDGAKGWDRVKGQGFSLQITTRQDVEALARRAGEAGAVLETPFTDTPWGIRIFRVRDLDGFLFTIASVRPSA